MKNELNILLTSVGRRSYLVKYFKNALNGRGRVHVANSTDISPAFRVADKSVVTPLIYDNNYISFLLDYCRENNICAIISLFDIDLPILSKHKAEFEAIGVHVIVSDIGVIDICNDKWNTYNFLKKNGFRAPATFLKLQDALDAVAAGSINYPLIIKPRWGMGSISINIVDNEEELKLLYNKSVKNIFDSYLKYESSVDTDNCVIIQEMLRGQEYGMDVINDLEGNYINAIVKKKHAMRSGETDCAVTVYDPEAKALGEKLSGLLKHIANLDADLFINDDGIYVLEMNARFGGGYPFSHLAGVDLPKAIIEWLSGNRADKALLTEKIGVMGQKDIQMVVLSEDNDNGE